MSGRNAMPHCTAAMLVTKYDTAQLGHSANNGVTEAILFLGGSWLVSWVYWGPHRRHH